MSSIDLRLAGLKRFATAITILTLLGHTVLGFEQAYAHVFVSLFAAYAAELGFETLDAWANGRKPRWQGGGAKQLVHFLLPAHIAGLAVAMLLYTNQRFWPVVMAAVVAIGSKYILRVTTPEGRRHFMNPSNTGICTALLLFPWVGIAPPYQFSEGIYGVVDWALPAFLISVGTFLNGRFTKKLPLIAAWIAGFVIQALVRSWLTGTPVAAALNPMTGFAFLLFTFYMVTDPGTTPVKLRSQVAFGASVALAYGVLMTYHIVFGLFFALFTVCAVRGCSLYLQHRHVVPAAAPEGFASKV